MNIDLALITTNALIAVPIVIALTQAIKLTGFVKDHFAPLVSIAFGILVSWLGAFTTDEYHIATMLLSGTVYGLMASGLYSGVKTTMLARSRQKRQEHD